MEQGKKTKQAAMPRLLIGAPESGSGKTLITCGLLELFKRRGLRPAACKCGPDYIDPMFHKYVLGIPGRNLDSFFLEPEQARDSLIRLFQEEKGEIAVLEGVMGYYDGAGGISAKASTWEIASITDTPAILVLDCRGASLSAAAMAAGFVNFREDSRIEGFILNRVSELHFQSLAPVLERETGLPVFGYLPQSEEYQIESRHLGLFLPGELEHLRDRMKRLAEELERTVDVEGLLRLARGAAELSESRRGVLGEAGFGHKVRLRIGVARDEAFCFYYQENLDVLERLGAELVLFSPLRDEALPEGLYGLLLGGGYPENYAGRLAGNEGMKKAIKEAVEAGMPVLAECGGFLYLHRTLEGSDGAVYPMAGVVDAAAFRTGKPGRFGYVSLTSPDGLVIRGHEFHYWESESPGTDWRADKPVGKRGWQCMHEGRGENGGSGGQIWGFPHLYYPSNPEFIRRWLGACKAYRDKELGKGTGAESQGTG